MAQKINEDHVFYRTPTKVYPTVDRGEGVYIYDKEGKQYIDGSGGGGADGVKGDHSLLAPPFVITEAQIDRMVQILDEAIGEVEAKVIGS